MTNLPSCDASAKSPLWRWLVLLGSIGADVVVLVYLCATINLAFGIISERATDGNSVTSPLELNTNVFIPIAVALVALAAFLCRDDPKLGKVAFSNCLLLPVLIVADLAFGYWLFAGPLEGALKFSERIWWLHLFDRNIP